MAVSKKTDFDEIKFLKKFAVRLNEGTKLTFIGNKETNSIEVYFDTIEHCLLRALIQPEDCKFSNWLLQGNRQITMGTATLMKLSKTLKANVVSVGPINENIFQFKVIDKETEEEKEYNFTSESFIYIAQKKREMFEEKLNIIREQSTGLQDIPNELMEKELLKLFNDSGKITEERTGDKIIEIPVYNLYPNFAKKERACRISFSNKDANKQRYVYIDGEEEKTHLRFEMIFLTI